MGTPHPTVLHVDEDSDDTFYLRRALQKHNVDCNLRALSTVPAAKSYLRGEAPYTDRAHYPMPAVMVTDMTMPDLGESSVDLVSWVRSIPETETLPIICATGHDNRQMIEQFAKLGVVSHLKTSHMTEVVDAVEAAFRDIAWRSELLRYMNRETPLCCA